MRAAALALAAACCTGCGDRDTHSPVAAAGSAAGTGTRLLEAGSAALQDKPPVEALNAYLDGFHFYSGRMGMQMEAHHYCAVLGEDLIQCVIYDGNVRDAKIMGVEYIVSERLFKDLPPEEKALWHSHVHEVKSGQLVAPGLPAAAEHALMRKLVRTYGKTWHTWHTDLHRQLPLGVPQLMMGFTADGQVDPRMVDARDRRFGIDSARRRQEREDIDAPAVDPHANGWQHGRAYQVPDPAHAPHGPGSAPGQSR